MTRISPRGYSGVKNLAPATAAAIRPMNTPARLRSTVIVGADCRAWDHGRDIGES